uniref:Integrase catalytic domain-containing protein n=1 Tax=Strongyloides papillosus TaxID=174720 RepID=A0A0N5CCE3_STREA
KITSESKQEFFEANDNVALKNLLTNAGKCVHLDFFNLDNKIGYCYGFIEDGTFQYRKMLGKSNSIELNFKLKGYLNLLQMVHMKGFNNTIITIYDVILFSALKDPDSIQSLTQPNRALFSSLASGKHIKTILIDQNCSYELVGNIRNAIKHFTVSNTKNYEISGVE